MSIRSDCLDYFSLADSRAVLRLATLWQCQRLRNRALKRLDLLAPPLEKLLLARLYSIQRWLIPACTALVLRDVPLSIAEARELDLEDVVRIFSAREEIFRRRLRLSDASAAARAHFSSISVTLLTPRDTTASQEASSHSSASADDNVAIIVSGHAPHPRQHEAETKSSRTGLSVERQAVCSFLEGNHNAMIELLTDRNVDEVVCALSESPGFLSGPKKRRVYDGRAASLAVGAMRHGVLDRGFLSVGTRFAASILRIGNGEQSFMTSLKSLEARYKEFVRLGGRAVPKRDKCKIMPDGLAGPAYLSCMWNGHAFVTELSSMGLFSHVKWLQQSSVLGPQAPTCLATLPAIASRLQAADDEFHDSQIRSVDSPVDGAAFESAGIAEGIPYMSDAVDEASRIDVAVCAILDNDYDGGVLHFTPDNVATIWLALSKEHSFHADLPEPAQGDHRTAPVSQLARAIVRRAFRDPVFAFVPAGTSVLTALTTIAPWLSRNIVGSFHAVIGRWGQFIAANGDCLSLKVDGGHYMSDGPPSSIGTLVYQERMERGKDVMQAAVEEDALVGSEQAAQIVAKRARRLARI